MYANGDDSVVNALEAVEELSAAVLLTDGEHRLPTGWTRRCECTSWNCWSPTSEPAELRSWADRADVQFRDDFDERVGEGERETTALADRLAERADPAWHDRFDDTLA